MFVWIGGFYTHGAFIKKRTSPGESHDTDPNPLLRFLKNLGRNIKATGVYFLIGILLSALFQRYVPMLQEWLVSGMNMDGHDSEKMQSGRPRSRQLLVIAAVLGVFCVSLFVIRFVNAKSNDKQMRLNKKSITLTVGNSQKLKVRNLPDTAKVTWKSSKRSVVSVSKKGRIKAKKEGRATIRCKVTYSGKKNKTRT